MLMRSWTKRLVGALMYHLESFGADTFQHPAECPKLAQPKTGIFIDGDAGSNSLFGGHDNMVGKRISQEFLNLQHRHTLAMITDEAMTYQVSERLYSWSSWLKILLQVPCITWRPSNPGL